MPWQVLENVIRAKDVRRGTEDASVFVSEHCFAVLDGHSNTNSRQLTSCGLTYGQYIVEAGLEAFNYYDGERPKRFVELLSRHVAEALHREGIEESDRPGFVFVAFLPQLGSIMRVGDAQFMTHARNVHDDNPGHMVDRVKGEVRASMIRSLLKQCSVPELQASDPTRATMADMKSWQHTYRNSLDPTFGYGVIDGSIVPTKLIELFTVDAETDRIVLTSDGYPPQVIRDTFAKTELALRELLARDPLCYREWVTVRGVYPPLDRPDDCTYLSIKRT